MKHSSKKTILIISILTTIILILIILLAFLFFSKNSSPDNASVQGNLSSSDSSNSSPEPSSTDTILDTSDDTADTKDSSKEDDATSADDSSSQNDEASNSEDDASENDISEDDASETDSSNDASTDSENDMAKDSEEPVSYPQMKIMTDPQIYSYADFISDLDILKEQYSDDVEIRSLTQTPDNREVYDIIIGDPNASRQILIHGGIHAREYMTSQLVMKQTVTFLQHLNSETDAYADTLYRDLLGDMAIHIIPMVNPDGISISQYGLSGVQTDAVLSYLSEIASMDGCSLDDASYLSSWKSNAQGIDLNRCFDARWEEYVGSGHPSSDKYKGTMIGDAPEAKALIDLTNSVPFVRTISYHTAGPLIYSRFEQFNQTAETTAITDSWARELSNATGYQIDENYNGVDAAGYKDWALSKLNIPSITIETGSGTSPVDPAQFNGVWAQNEHVIEITLANVANQ